MKSISLLNPYSFYYIYKTQIGKDYINNVINHILKTKEEYEMLPFLNENINNVRSYVILESKINVVFIDFNFKMNDNLLKNNYALFEYLKFTNNKPVYMIIINDYPGKNNEINNIYDIYNNSYKFKELNYLYTKGYFKQLLKYPSITKYLYRMNKEEYKIYCHENILKNRI